MWDTKLGIGTALGGLGLGAFGMGGGGGGMGGVPWLGQAGPRMAAPGMGGGVWDLAGQAAGMGIARPSLAQGFAANAARDRGRVGGSMGYDTWQQPGGNPFSLGGSRGGFPGGGGGGGGYGGGGYGGGQSDSMLRSFMASQNAARAANLQRYNNIIRGFDLSKNDAIGMLNQTSNQGQTDITNRFGAQQAQATQDLMNRGLGNTTVTSAVSRGINNDMSAEQRRWLDQMNQRKIDAKVSNEREKLAFMERRNDF